MAIIHITIDLFLLSATLINDKSAEYISQIDMAAQLNISEISKVNTGQSYQAALT